MDSRRGDPPTISILEIKSNTMPSHVDVYPTPLLSHNILDLFSFGWGLCDSVKTFDDLEGVKDKQGDIISVCQIIEEKRRMYDAPSTTQLPTWL
jgi:hypothetical protein